MALITKERKKGIVNSLIVSSIVGGALFANKIYRIYKTLGYKLSRFTFLKSDPEAVYFKTEITFENPTQKALDIKGLKGNIFYQSKKIGTFALPNKFVLGRGETKMNLILSIFAEPFFNRLLPSLKQKGGNKKVNLSGTIKVGFFSIPFKYAFDAKDFMRYEFEGVTVKEVIEIFSKFKKK